SPNKIVGYTKDDDGVVIVDSLEDWNKIKDKKRKQEILEVVAQEMQKRHEEHNEFKSLMTKFVTALGVIAAVGAAFYTYKLIKGGEEETSEKEEEKKDSKDVE
nr:3A [Human cosavirus B]